MPGAIPISTCAEARDEQLVLSIEHRAAPSTTGICLELRSDGAGLSLVIGPPTSAPPVVNTQSLEEQIHAALQNATQPLTVIDLRRICRVRTSTLCNALAELTKKGRLCKAERGYQAVP
jgi:hypothetical protein